MRKVVLVLSTLLLSFNLFGTTWDFEALGISFSTPDEVVGMAIPDNQIINHVDNQVPIQVFSGTCEDYSVNVTAQYMPIETFVLMSEDLLLSLWGNDSYIELFRSMGMNITDVSTYRAGVLDTVRYEVMSDAGGSRVFVVLYQTIVNQYCLTFGITVDYSNRYQLNTIADGIIDTLTVIGSGMIPDCFNPEITLISGATVECPEDCSYAYTLRTAGAYIYRGDELVITISESDLYSAMTPYEQIHTERYEVNNDMYPPRDMALNLGLPVSAVKTEMIGGREWYRVEGYNGDESIVYCRIYDGYFDLFFAEEDDIQLLKSMLLTFDGV